MARVETRRGVQLSSIYQVTANSVNEMLDHVRPNIRRWHNDPKITHIYIGKTSARSNSTDAAYDGIETRIDDAIDRMGATNMKLLYITSSADYIDTAERELIDYNLKQSGKARNERGGGGGAPTEQPYHVLYAALTIRGDRCCMQQ